MRVVDLGIIDFSESYKIQNDLVQRIASGFCENTLLIAEHKPVITIGRMGSWKNILKSTECLDKKGITIIKTDRGGDVTYHGPGQIVAYPIIKLENEARDIYNFLDFLEEVGNAFLHDFGLESQRKKGYRGVWVKDEKIGSIGIGVKKWVTYHGMALNINNDISHFSFIRPCGIEGIKMTSLKNILNKEVDMDYAKNRLGESFKKIPLLVDSVNT